MFIFVCVLLLLLLYVFMRSNWFISYNNICKYNLLLCIYTGHTSSKCNTFIVNTKYMSDNNELDTIIHQLITY